MLSERDGQFLFRGREGLQELSRGCTYADRCDCDPWQFAIEIGQLNGLGLTNSDLRLLMESGYLRHAREATTIDSPKRLFCEMDARIFTPASCFVLTESGVMFCRRIGAATDAGDATAQPHWDITNRELRLRHVLVKRYRCPAVNQETILSVFQEEGWPDRIDDPLPPSDDCDSKRRLHDTIKSLNKNQINRVIRFRGDGTGQGVTWELLKAATRAGCSQAPPDPPHVACSGGLATRYNELRQEGFGLR